MEQWGYTGRFTVQHDVGQNGYFQWAASGFHTNGGLLAEADTDGDGVADVEAGVGQTTLAVDLTLRVVDASALTANTASMEVWYTDREALAEPSAAVEDREALGLWGFYQHDFDPHWGAGVMAGWWQEPGESTSAGVFERDEAGAMRAAYVDWRLSEFNRLRLQLTQFVPEEGGSAWAVALQWDVILGSHSHPLDF
jgi:hypothetical protein